MAVKPAKIALAYCAGIIDGEGCISIGKRSRVRHNNLGHNQYENGIVERKDSYYLDYKLNIIVVQKERILCDWLKGNFGGSIGIVRRDRPDRIDTYYRWVIGTNQSTQLLKKIKFYLVIKRQQAEDAIEFGKHMNRNLYKYITPEKLAFREKYYQRLKKIKKERAAATTKPNPDLQKA